MKMRVAIIGCGSISSTHIKALIGSGEEIAALCDIEEEKAFEKKSKYELNSAVYTDYKKMLAGQGHKRALRKASRYIRSGLRGRR